MTNKEAIEKIKQTCLEQDTCNVNCPIYEFCFHTLTTTFPESWETDLIKEGE